MSLWLVLLAVLCYSLEAGASETNKKQNKTAESNGAVDPKDIRFLYYKNCNIVNIPYVFNGNINGSVLANRICSGNQNQAIEIISHGYTYVPINPHTTNIMNAINKRRDCILVDWTYYSIGYALNEEVTCNAIPGIGEIVAKMFIKLIENDCYKMEDITNTGFSLGAQIAGASSRSFTNLIGLKLKRIVALDPSNRCLYTNNNLSASDADFVEAIHTSNFTGPSSPVSTLDIYVTLPFFDITGELLHHLEVNNLYAASIRYSQRIWAKNERNLCAYIGGYQLNENAKGIYNYTSLSLPPFYVPNIC